MASQLTLQFRVNPGLGFILGQAHRSEDAEVVDQRGLHVWMLVSGSFFKGNEDSHMPPRQRLSLLQSLCVLKQSRQVVELSSGRRR